MTPTTPHRLYVKQHGREAWTPRTPQSEVDRLRIHGPLEYERDELRQVPWLTLASAGVIGAVVLLIVGLGW